MKKPDGFYQFLLSGHGGNAPGFETQQLFFQGRWLLKQANPESIRTQHYLPISALLKEGCKKPCGSMPFPRRNGERWNNKIPGSFFIRRRGTHGIS
ncbi:MAG: hypothetical protein V8Q21_11920 [Akkermansia muciniphila]